MLKLFLENIENLKLLKSGDKVLLAISGGIDSMVMAHLFLRSGIKCGIAHCNFSLRGKESDEDEAFVRNFAYENNLPFHTVKFDTPEYARRKKVSIEMAARELRYEWFGKISNEAGYDHIAVAHNLNDNAETLLLNLVRGTGIAGLKGMKAKSNNIIRPLLFTTRDEILNYSDEFGVQYRNDSTNTDTSFKRNKIRHKVMPLLKEFNPSIITSLNETAIRLEEISRIADDYIGKVRELLFRERKNGIRISISLLRNYSENKSLIFELFREFNLRSDMLPEFLKLTRARTGGQLITGTHRFIKNRDEIIITENLEKKATTLIFNNLRELKNSPFLSSATLSTPEKTTFIKVNPAVAAIDYEKLSFPVIIRRWEKGDYFFPFGMSGRKKLSDYFTGRKFSGPEKEDALILESGGRIVWIIGERLDNRFRITDSTRKILVMKAAD